MSRWWCTTKNCKNCFAILHRLYTYICNLLCNYFACSSKVCVQERAKETARKRKRVRQRNTYTYTHMYVCVHTYVLYMCVIIYVRERELYTHIHMHIRSVRAISLKVSCALSGVACFLILVEPSIIPNSSFCCSSLCVSI